MNTDEYIFDTNIFFRSTLNYFESYSESDRAIQNFKNQRFLATQNVLEEIGRGLNAVEVLKEVALKNFELDEKVIGIKLNALLQQKIKDKNQDYALAIDIITNYVDKKTPNGFECASTIRKVLSKLREYIQLLDEKLLPKANLLNEKILKILSKGKNNNRSTISDSEIIDDVIYYATQIAGSEIIVSFVTLEDNLILKRQEIIQLICQQNTKLAYIFDGSVSKSFDIIHLSRLSRDS